MEVVLRRDLPKAPQHLEPKPADEDHREQQRADVGHAVDLQPGSLDRPPERMSGVAPRVSGDLVLQPPEQTVGRKEGWWGAGAEVGGRGGKAKTRARRAASHQCVSSVSKRIR